MTLLSGYWHIGFLDRIILNNFITAPVMTGDKQALFSDKTDLKYFIILSQLNALQLPSMDAEATSSLSAATEMKPVPFGSYHSPLLVFKSYR